MAITKQENGKDFTARDYAFTPDDSSLWELRLTNTPSGTPDKRIVGAAVAALGPGFRGQKVQIPSDALLQVKTKVRAAWLKANADKSRDDLPRVLKSTDISDNTDIPTWEELLVGEQQISALADDPKAQDPNGPATTEPDGGTKQPSQSEAYGMTHDEIIQALGTELEDESKLDELVKKAGLEDEGVGATKDLLRFLTAVKDKVPVEVLTEAVEIAGYELPEKVVEKIVVKEVTKKEEKEEVLSEIPEEYRAKLETLFKEQNERQEAVKKEAEEIKKELKEEKDQRRTEKVEQELSENYKALAIASKDFAPIYKSVEDSLTPEQFEEFKRVLTSANELAARAIDYKSIGATGSNDTGTGIDKIDKQAKELVAKGDYKTYEIAYDALLSQNPELYDEYLAEGSRRN